MRVVDPGHYYELSQLDGPVGCAILIRFVKREGLEYPGNVGCYPGTNNQECLRALIDRTQYLNKQRRHWVNWVSIWLYRIALNLLEYRAARRHGRWFWPHLFIEHLPFDQQDGHIRYE